MALDIALKIYIPEKLIIDKKVYRVVLPYKGNTLTVIKGRAPTLLPLEMGAVKILDESNKAVEEYYISGGAADIKEDTCTILTEAAFEKSSLDLAQVKALNEEFPNPFYAWLEKVYETDKAFRP